MMRRYLALHPLLLLAFLTLATGVRAQDEIEGIVRGRVLDPGGKALSDVDVEVLVVRGSRTLVVARTKSGFDGSYLLKTGALVERASLRLRHGRFAPRELRLRSLHRGAGLLVPDLVLDAGRVVTIDAVTDLALPAGTLQVEAFPIDEDQRLVDIDGPPIASALMEEGRARLRLPDGLFAFVVGDGRARLAPELMVWKVSEATTALPPIAIRAGLPAVFRVVSPSDGDFIGDLVIGSGSWHPDGGAEYRMRLRVGGRMEAAERSELILPNLPTGAFSLELESGRLRARVVGVPGEAEREILLRPGGRVRGEVRLGGSIETVAGARIWIGDRLVATNEDGAYVVDGLLPGAHRVFVARPGLDGGARGRIVIDDFGHERRLDLQVEPGARVSGTARDLDLKVLPDVLIGVEPEPDLDFGIGRSLLGRSDEAGDFELRGLPSGPVRISIVAPGDSVSLDEVLELEPNAIATVRPRLGVAARGRGRIELADGSPAVRAEVWMIGTPAPRSMARGHDLLPSDQGLVARRLQTDDDGRYRFVGLEPGRYDRVVVRRGAPAELAGAVDLAPGSNEIGMDWRLGAGRPLVLDLPEEVMLRLRAESDERIDHWLWRPAGAPPLVLHELPPGVHRIEQMRGGVSRIADEDLPYREHRPDRALARVGHPALETAAVPDPEGAAFAALRLHLLVQGDPPGGRRMEITAYPLAGSWPLRPLRFEAPLEGATLDLELPRGVYLLHGRVPELAEGWAGPLTLATGFDQRGATELVLDLAAHCELIGRIVVEGPATGADRVMSAEISGPSADLVRPYDPPRARALVATDGVFRLEHAPSGSVVLRLGGRDLELERELELQPFQVVDLGELAPEEQRQPRLDLDRRALVGASVEDPQGRFLPRVVRLPRLSGAFQAAIELEGQAGPSVWRARRLAVVDRFPALIERSDLQGQGRSGLRARLAIDRERLAFWPLALVPIDRDAYDFDRPGFDLVSDENGEVAASALPAGQYALRFDYRDELGHDYRLAIPLLLEDSSAAARPDLELFTRELKVTVRDAADGSAVEGAIVRVKRSDLRGLEHSRVFRREIATVSSGRSDDEGAVWFRKMPLGHYDVEVSMPGYARARHLSFDLSALGARRVVEMGLERGQRLELRVIADDRRPLRGMRVLIFDAQGLPVHDDRLLLTDMDGRLELADLPAGYLDLLVRGAGFPAQRLGRVATAPGRRVFEELPAVAGVPVEVVCRQPGGRPLPGARIALNGPEGGGLHGSEADRLDEGPGSVSPGGARRLLLLPGENCRIRAEKAGFLPAERTVRPAAGRLVRVVLDLERIP